MFRIRSELSRVIATKAELCGRRSCVPAKMTSCMELPRSCFTFCSPSTQRTASEMFDFPEPFGPTMPVMPLLKSRTVLFAKDLKP